MLDKVKYLWKDLERCARGSHIPWRDGAPSQYPGAKTLEVRVVVILTEGLSIDIALGAARSCLMWQIIPGARIGRP